MKSSALVGSVPLIVQYADFISRAVTGDFGRSLKFNEPVMKLVVERLPATIELAVLAMLIAGTLGIAGGLLMFHVRGTRKEPIVDTVLSSRKKNALAAARS